MSDGPGECDGFSILDQKRTKKNKRPAPAQKPQSHPSRARVERTGAKEHLKAKFLEKFAELKTIGAAAKATGVSRWAVQDWRKKDKAFDRDFSETDLGTSEMIEANAVNFCIDGVTQYAHDPMTGKLMLDKAGKPIVVALKHDPKLIQFMLERRLPEKYGKPSDTGADVQVAKWLAAKAVEAINAIIPACCPGCKTDLRLKDKIAEHLLHLSSTMKVEA